MDRRHYITDYNRQYMGSSFSMLFRVQDREQIVIDRGLMESFLSSTEDARAASHFSKNSHKTACRLAMFSIRHSMYFNVHVSEIDTGEDHPASRSAGDTWIWIALWLGN